MIAAVTVAFLLLAGGLIAKGYHNSIEQAEALTLERLETTARLAALQLDGEAHAGIMRLHRRVDDITGNDDDERYRVLHEVLADVHERAGLTSPVYTYVLDSATTTFQFAVTSARKPYFRHSFTTFPAEALRTYSEGGALGEHRDEFGTWLSGVAPLRDRRGRVIAAVQVDEKFDTFISRSRAGALTDLFIGLAVLCLLMGVLLQYLRANLKRERHTREAMAEAFLETHRLSEELAGKERALRANAAELERSNRDLRDFASIASHDLRSPLRGIAAFSQLLAKRHRATLDQEGGEYLEFILSNSRRAIDLVDGLLEYAKAGISAREATTFDLATVVGYAIENLQHPIELRGAEVSAGELPAVVADESLLTQVFQNLIANGLKYNRAAVPRVRVDAERDPVSGDWIFSVCDNGIGIAPEYQASIFDMFERVHRTEEYEGSGIGLAFCSRVVAGYGGTVWLDSEPGVGSKFHFTLPRCLPTESVVAVG